MSQPSAMIKIIKRQIPDFEHCHLKVTLTFQLRFLKLCQSLLDQRIGLHLEELHHLGQNLVSHEDFFVALKYQFKI